MRWIQDPPVRGNQRHDGQRDRNALQNAEQPTTSSTPYEPGADDRCTKLGRSSFNLQLRSTVVRATTFERAHGRQQDSLRNSSRRSSLEQTDTSVHVHPPDVVRIGNGEVIGAMHQPVGSLKPLRIERRIEPVRNGRFMARSVWSARLAYQPPGGSEVGRQSGSHVTGRPRHDHAPGARLTHSSFGWIPTSVSRHRPPDREPGRSRRRFGEHSPSQ